MQRVNLDAIDIEYTTSGSPVYTCQDGKFQHWYEDGKIKDEGVCELGYIVKRKEWAKNGNLINGYNIEKYP